MSLVPDDELAKLVREEPAGARDRKEEAPGVDHPAPKTAPDENELRLREAAALRSQVANYEAALRAIDAEAAALEAGTHPEFVARAAPITAARDARIARSQRAHRAQLAALDKLRDAEVQASEDEVKRRVASLEAKLAERKAAAAKGKATCAALLDAGTRIVCAHVHRSRRRRDNISGPLFVDGTAAVRPPSGRSAYAYAGEFDP